MSIWDDPELKSNDDFVKFDTVGDTVTGRVIDVRSHRFDDGKVVPQILLDCDGAERTLTCGAIRLKAEMVEKRPEQGDTITVTLTQEEKRAGGKTLRHWQVDVNRGGAAPAPAAAPAAQPTADPAPAAQNDQAAAIAALGNLTDEQKKLLGIG